MSIALFGSAISTSNNTTEATTLADGRIAVQIFGGTIAIYSPNGAQLGTVDMYQGGAGIVAGGNGGSHIEALADGGFVVTGARGSSIGFRIYNADLTERTAGPVIIATPGFFNGGTNYGHVLEALPGGGFVVEWNTNIDQVGGALGVTSTGVPIYEGGSGPQGTAIDVRGSIYGANGALVGAGGFLVTQGTVQFTNYQVESRFGQQYVSDIDVLADGSIVSTIYGQRWSPPSGGDLNATYTGGYFYDSFRVNNGATGAAITGETPYNATASIGANMTAGNGPHQTVVLTSGLIAGLYTVDTGVSGAGQYQSRMQLMNANGVAVGGAVDLALQFGGSNINPSIAAVATASGGFVIAYRAPPTYADAGTSSLYDVYIREYAANGTVIATQQVTSATGIEDILNFTRGPDGLMLLTTRLQSGLASTQLVAITGAGDTVTNGGGTAEVLNGTGTNRAYVFSGGGADTLNGGTGTNYLYGGSGNSTFIGGSGVNIMRGGSGNETMVGGAQNDTMIGGIGNDAIDGSGGNDAALFSAGRSAYYVRSFASGGTIYTQVSAATGTEGQDTLVRIETLGFNSGAQAFGLAGIQQNLVSNMDGSYFDDVLFQNSSTGQIIYQNMTGGTASGYGNVLGSLPSGWRLVGSDDFTGDGRADVLVQNTANGSIYTVNIGSGSPVWTAVTTGLTSAYQAIASGDVTRDGTADVLVRDTATGQTFIADLNAGGTFGGWLAGPNLGTGWRTVGLGDFNRDGASDVLVQNIADGTTYYRDIANGQWGTVAGPAGAQWVARESADLNGDGYADVVFQNASTGDIWWVNMLGGTNTGWNVVANGLSGWEVRGSADVDNDGWRDVIIQNTSNGTTYWADMNAGVFGGFGAVSGALGTQWLAVG